MSVERLKEIMGLASRLGWFLPPKTADTYPLMQASEVEKCMVAMYDDFELNRMRGLLLAIQRSNGSET